MKTLLKDTNGVFNTRSKYKLVYKIAILLSTLMFLAILATGLLNYNKNVNLILRNLQNQLQLAANTISISIDGDTYARLQGKASLNTPEYKKTREVLERFMVNRYLGFESDGIYTFRQISEDSLEFTVMLYDQYVGNRYRIRDEMRPALEKGIPSYTGIYEDENGTWVSAYSPILNSRGEVVGLVEVDFRDNIYLQAVENEIYAVVYFSAAGVIIAILISILLSRIITRPIVNVSNAAIAFSKGDAHERIPVTTQDEIGTLTKAFNFMVEEVRKKELYRKEKKELARAYEKLNIVNKSLKEANRLKDEFLAVAVHDLKNPLQSIMGYNELIVLKMMHQKTKIAEWAEEGYMAAKRMLKIVNQLLKTSAFEEGKIDLKKEFVDISYLTKSVVNANLQQAQNKKQKMIFSAQERCMAMVDADKMYEAVDNLVSNAIKYSQKGKRIWIHVTKPVSINGSPNQVIIEIQDEGPGLTEGDKQMLFGKFQKLSAKPTGGESSSGLGLSVVKGYVELHDGKVWAESEGRGKGTTFYLQLNER